MKRRNFIAGLGAFPLFAGAAPSEAAGKPPCGDLLFKGAAQEGTAIKTLPRGGSAAAPGEIKIHILGACSGTAPKPNAKHTALVVQESDGTPLWFDAGEFSSWTAYLMGVDFRKLKNVFISHPHLDHTAGLPGLFDVYIHGYHKQNIWSKKAREEPISLDVYAPEQGIVDAAFRLYSLSSRGCHNFAVRRKKVFDGKIFGDAEACVEALQNRHMWRFKNEDGEPVSYSYRIKFKGGKTVVFSGDVKSLDDMKPWLTEGCDLLMMETGHHRAAAVCKALKKEYPKVGDVLFLHHGTQILRNPEAEKAAAEKAWGAPLVFADDGMTVCFK